MPTHILKNLPYRKQDRAWQLQNRPASLVSQVIVKAFQIATWVSLIPSTEKSFKNLFRFPAILDPGFTGQFSIRRDQIKVWTSLDNQLNAQNRASIRTIHTQAGNLEAEIYRGISLLIYPNIPSQFEPDTNRDPLRLELSELFVTPIQNPSNPGRRPSSPGIIRRLGQWLCIISKQAPEQNPLEISDLRPLPLLGLGAITMHELDFQVNGAQLSASLIAPE